MIPLLFATAGEEVKVASVGGNPEVRQHLAELGFTVGSPVTVMQKIDTGIIVKVKESRIAVDRGMASKIMV